MLTPTLFLRYYSSDMILCLISDAAYLVLPNASSCYATLFTLTDKPTTNPPKPTPNGPLHVIVKTIKGVPASAAEAETGGIFSVLKKLVLFSLLSLKWDIHSRLPVPPQNRQFNCK